MLLAGSKEALATTSSLSIQARRHRATRTYGVCVKAHHRDHMHTAPNAWRYLSNAFQPAPFCDAAF